MSLLMKILKFWEKPVTVAEKHRHDFDMDFRDNSLEYTLRCSCGETAIDMDDALNKMGLT
jgi:hypothetical protein